MSPTDSNLSGGKGKKRPGKPGRFDPSEPLHMTTRRAARSKSNGGTPSVNGSVDGDYSRRGSLDDSRPSTSQGESSEYSNKSRRTSNGSVAVVSPGVTPNGQVYKTVADEADVPSLTLSSSQPSPSRKRKRSSSTMRPQIRSVTPSAFADEPVQSLELTSDTKIEDAPNNDITVEATAEKDAVEPDPSQHRSEREEVSQHSSQSVEEQRLPFDDYSYQSAENTPAVSNAPSPQFQNSDSDEQQTPPEPNDVAMENEADDQDEIEDPIEEMDVDTEMIEEAEEEPEGPNGQVRSGSSGERPRRRFGGRRRAQHPIPKVEKAMQRQAELKAHFRTLTRALKPVLAEIAKRTTDELEADPEAHTKAVEWPGVKQQLDDRLEQRKEQIRLQHQYSLEQLKKDEEQYAEVIKHTCRNEIEDLKDILLARMEMEMMRIAREAELHSAEGEHATDDEDGVVPRPKTASYRFKAASKPIEDQYLSRSWIYTEPTRALDQWDARRKMRGLLDQIPEDERPVPSPKRKFAVMDDGPRTAALARKEASSTFDILAQAATEVERATKKQKIIRNEDCHGLQLLGDLASRPSLTASIKPAKGSHPRRAASRPIPPQLHIQTSYRHSLIPVEMSPRTTQALGDRFEGTMLPPDTPGRVPGLPTFVRSPDLTRSESTLRSPTMNINRFNNPQPPRTGAAPELRPESQRTPFTGLARPVSEMRPPSGPRAEPEHSPSQQRDERSMDFPLWREYPRTSPGSLHRRSSSHNERPPVGLGIPQAMREDRQTAVLPRMQEATKRPEPPRDMISSFPQLQSRPPLWQDRLSQPGAADIRFQDQRSPPNMPPRPVFDSKAGSNAQSPSMGFVKDFRNSGIMQKEDPNRPSSKGSMTQFKTKTSKDERDGLSRRSWSNQRKMSKTLSGTGLAVSPPLTAAAPSPREVPPPPAPWRAPSQYQPAQHSPPVPPPPVSYQQSSYSQTLPHVPGFRPAQQTPEQFGDRKSFPPRPSSSSFDRLPPTPLYGMSQQQTQKASKQQEHGQQHQPPPPPPPPGVPAEQYNRAFQPPPPPGYQAPPPPASGPPHPSPQVAQQQPAPGSSYMSQFGGPPLAPAGGNAYHPPGFRPAPAFAQQAQQQQQQQQAQQQSGPGGHRRRTQSDASQFAKFQPWNPPSKRT